MLLVGKIINTHGVKGDIKLLHYTDNAAFFNEVEEIFIDNKAYKIKVARDHKGSVLLKISGVDDIMAAESLVGKEVYANKENVVLPEGRYFIVDIIGLKVLTDEGKNLGVVSDVFSTGSNDVYEIKDELGRKSLIPAISEVVLNIDITKKEMLIHVIEGLIDHEI